MNQKNTNWKENKVNMLVNRKSILVLLVGLLLIFHSYIVLSAPAAPTITYEGNSTYVSGTINRSQDAKGTITIINLSAIQQNYKWKAYVGHVSGSLALADANGIRIYDWTLGTPAGEVYMSRFSNIDWANISCAGSTAITNEQNNVSMGNSADNVSMTFNYTTHSQFLSGTTLIGGCRATATYINNTRQASINASSFQEILLQDTQTELVYASIINASRAGYNTSNYDFQMIVAENESSNTPSLMYFWVELG